VRRGSKEGFAVYCLDYYNLGVRITGHRFSAPVTRHAFQPLSPFSFEFTPPRHIAVKARCCRSCPYSPPLSRK